MAVLYDETARFSSIDDFFSRTRILSLEKYDVTCTPHHHTDETAVASCLLRQVCHCPYQVRAKRSGAGFVVDFDRSNWEHNHARGSREAVAPGIQKQGARQPERSDGDSRNYDSAIEDVAASTGEETGATGGVHASSNSTPGRAVSALECFHEACASVLTVDASDRWFPRPHRKLAIVSTI